MKKDNNRHNYGAREAWLKAKKQGRPKQVWVAILESTTMGGEEVPGIGRWTKIYLDEATNIDLALVAQRVTDAAVWSQTHNVPAGSLNNAKVFLSGTQARAD